MQLKRFIELFLKELESTDDFGGYYKILDSKKSLLFRKAYFEQRLEYVCNQIQKPNQHIWDLGCGFGTTSILLALNGHKVTGTTLEFYFDKIQKRIACWKHFGNLDNLAFKYENIFDHQINKPIYDAVVVQDTLHHLEPIKEALKIIYNSLKSDGQVIVIEENGNNIINSLKNFKQRGFNRITKIYDEKLKTKILFGNENTRGFKKWNRLFKQHGFEIALDKIQYIRLFPPYYFTQDNYTNILKREQNIWQKNKLLKEYFFFGLNFIARKNKKELS